MDVFSYHCYKTCTGGPSQCNKAYRLERKNYKKYDSLFTADMIMYMDNTNY